MRKQQGSNQKVRKALVESFKKVPGSNNAWNAGRYFIYAYRYGDIFNELKIRLMFHTAYIVKTFIRKQSKRRSDQSD